MIYQHPLAYLLGLEGIALLRAWAGDFDKDFVEARLAEVRALPGDPRLASHPGVEVWRGDVETGYRQWASSYDEPSNALFDIEEPIMHEILNRLPAGDAIDAACGTGRYSAFLAERGHIVLGVDSSPEMLAVARARLPRGEFRAGSLDHLPVADSSADLIVCSLALAHVPALGRAIAEFARVLRTGGHLVISDAHHELVFRGSVVKALTSIGEPGLVATYRHTTGDFLRAALPAGFSFVAARSLAGYAPTTNPRRPGHRSPRCPSEPGTTGLGHSSPSSLTPRGPRGRHPPWSYGTSNSLLRKTRGGLRRRRGPTQPSSATKTLMKPGVPAG